MMPNNKKEKAGGQSPLLDLERFARERISASRYPNDYHIFKPAACSACGVVPMELTIEHHTGSKKRNFRGIVLGLCSKCGKKEQIFKFTGKNRKPVREEKPVCECGSDYFYIGECERIEQEDGLLGFFDEGVFVGKCSECGRNRAFFYTD